MFITGWSVDALSAHFFCLPFLAFRTIAIRSLPSNRTCVDSLFCCAVQIYTIHTYKINNLALSIVRCGWLRAPPMPACIHVDLFTCRCGGGTPLKKTPIKASTAVIREMRIFVVFLQFAATPAAL